MTKPSCFFSFVITAGLLVFSFIEMSSAATDTSEPPMYGSNICRLSDVDKIDYEAGQKDAPPHVKVFFTRTNGNQHFNLVSEVRYSKLQEYLEYYFVVCEYGEGTGDVVKMDRKYELPFAGSQGFIIRTIKAEQKLP